MEQDTYKKIESYALTQMAYLKNSNHNDEHVVRVKNNALKIVELLGLGNKIDEKLLQITCLLHDFTYTKMKPSIYTYIFEGHIEKRVIKEVLDKFDLTPDQKNIISNAVYYHTHSFPFRQLNKEKDFYTKILQDADTIDYFNCKRESEFIKNHNKGVFKKFKKALASKYIELGIKYLDRFLNYPEVAKSFVSDVNMKCLPD